MSENNESAEAGAAPDPTNTEANVSAAMGRIFEAFVRGDKEPPVADIAPVVSAVMLSLVRMADALTLIANTLIADMEAEIEKEAELKASVIRKRTVIGKMGSTP